MMNEEGRHFVCEGTCKGVAKNATACGAADCTRHGEQLTPCDCEDDLHEAVHDTPEEEE